MTRGSFEDLTDHRFVRLLVIERAPNRGKRVYWLCRCDCGTVKEIRQDALRNGRASSCGCYQRDVVTKHGMWDSPEYGVWDSMLQRCESMSHHAYSQYGGRGIKVCERWHDFVAFYQDMYPKPSRWHSLDRIDNDGDYSPNNCRWATKKQQSRNRNDNHVLTYHGQERCVAEWAEICGMKASALFMRLKSGWTVEETLEIPVGAVNRWTHQSLLGKFRQKSIPGS